MAVDRHFHGGAECSRGTSNGRLEAAMRDGPVPLKLFGILYGIEAATRRSGFPNRKWSEPELF